MVQTQTAAIALIGDGGQYSSYSAEIEQVAQQKNEDCKDSTCTNNLQQTQDVEILGGGTGSGDSSYYVEQKATQQNIGCYDSSTCSNTLTQTQTVTGSGDSYSEEQIAVQKNIGCINSECTNTLEQTNSTDETKQYNIGCINSTCVNPSGSGDYYNIRCINTSLCDTSTYSYNIRCIKDFCAYQGDGKPGSNSYSTLSTKYYKPVSETQSLTISDATEIEEVTTANSESGQSQT